MTLGFREVRFRFQRATRIGNVPKSRHPRMSVRELEVAARVKAGMSACQIAADLGIAETTVITHRNGAYARMGVANLRELLLA